MLFRFTTFYTSDNCYYYYSLTWTHTEIPKHTTPTIHSFTHSLHFFRFRCLPSPYVGSDDNNADNDADFKCDKCDSNEGVISSQKETTTILKDNAKPILKFSVSAILGDKKECARVRHGKCIYLIWFAWTLFASAFWFWKLNCYQSAEDDATYSMKWSRCYFRKNCFKHQCSNLCYECLFDWAIKYRFMSKNFRNPGTSIFYQYKFGDQSSI